MNDVVATLFPEPPRRVPAHRALGVALRTVHVAAFAALLGGHLFDVDAARLLPWLYAAIASGASLMVLELLGSCAWLSTGKGLAVLVKLSLLAVVPWCWAMTSIMGRGKLCRRASSMPSGT